VPSSRARSSRARSRRRHGPALSMITPRGRGKSSRGADTTRTTHRRAGLEPGDLPVRRKIDAEKCGDAAKGGDRTPNVRATSANHLATKECPPRVPARQDGHVANRFRSLAVSVVRRARCNTSAGSPSDECVGALLSGVPTAAPPRGRMRMRTPSRQELRCAETDCLNRCATSA